MLQQISSSSPSPLTLVSTWLLDRIFGSDLDLCPVVIQPTRDFCMALLAAKIECTFRRCLGRFASRHEYNPARARLSAARDLLLRLVPRVLPRTRKGLDEAMLYRFVLDHGDFGIHNMTIAKDAQDDPYISSVYDWEAGAIVPALFSEPKMVVTADLVVDDDGEPSVSRWGDGDSMLKMAEYVAWFERVLQGEGLVLCIPVVPELNTEWRWPGPLCRKFPSTKSPSKPG